MFTYLDIYLSLLPVVAFFIYQKNLKSELGIKLIVTYSVIFFLINFLMLNWKVIPILYDVNTLIEFLLFSGFLFVQLKSKISKYLLRVFAVLFTVCYIGFIIYTKSAADTSSIPRNQVVIDSIPIGFETIILLGFSFYFLYESTKDTTTLFIYQTFQFWVILGIVLYLAGSFFIYIFSNYLSGSEVRKYWVITNVFSILRSVFFCIAIVLHSKPTKNNILITDLELTYLN